MSAGFDGSHPPRDAYPRPQLQRSHWQSLDGLWQFVLDHAAEWTTPDQVDWDETTIQVPFAPETPASGINDTGFFNACWYRRRIDTPDSDGGRLILHFEAVDYVATVWVNGRRAVHHVGGYTPFAADITDLLVPDAQQEIVVRAEDDPHDLAKPRGKQDWQLNPHSIWYHRTTGIWQTVWLEVVPAVHIKSLRWCSSLERWEISLEASVAGPVREGWRLAVHLSVGDILLADDSYAVVAGEVSRRIGLSDPGIDDFRNELLWNPASPTLISARLTLFDEHGRSGDYVDSYTAIRSISVQGDRFVLNGRPYPLRMILDQGYWPESGQTAPDDDALRRDVELALAMGFNGVRKHQKIESQRYLFWADTLGLLVWEEMPSAYRFTKNSIERLTREWTEVIERDHNHPCVIAWVPFNESWGVPDLPDSPTQRHYVQALYHLTRTLDASRPVIGNDGWESVATDLIGIHDYDDQPKRLMRRYASDLEIPRLFRRERPGGKLLVIGDAAGVHEQPIMLTEFGGIAYAPNRPAAWGYSRVESQSGFAAKYAELMAAIHACTVFAGFCYTQFADTYQEANGLLFADRTPKIPLDQIALATRGGNQAFTQSAESEWRDRIMEVLRHQYLAPLQDHRIQDNR